jgi:glucose-1-phosphate thymidylyltransferase
MEIAKALVLAGRTLADCPWPSAPAGPKHLVPVANQPILFHNLEALRGAGMLEATIAVDAGDGGAIERAVGDGSYWQLNVRYADCAPYVGLLGALAAARENLDDEPVIVQQGDALLQSRMQPYIHAFARETVDVLSLRLRSAMGGDARAVTPAYLLSPRAVSILLDRPMASTDPVAAIRARGGVVQVEYVDGCLPCHGGQEALLESNRRLLDGLVSDVEPSCMRDNEIQGAVVVHPTARLQRCIVRGPAIIGPGCQLTDAYVGPFSSIGSRVVIEGAEIEHSIVLPGAEIRFVGARLESSVIGRNARIVRGFGLPSAMRISVGDGAEVSLT